MSECGKNYTGQTGRSFDKRLKEPKLVAYEIKILMLLCVNEIE
jgi:hypothetical protein